MKATIGNTVAPIETQQTTVLIVDDHPVYLDGISMILSDLLENAEIIQAVNAKQALEIATNRIDLDWIFTDFQLPDSDGMALVKAFNNLFLTAPIVLMSGLDDVELVFEALELGVSGFIHKAGGKSVFKECLAMIEAGDTFLMPELKVRLEQYRQSVLKEKNRVVAQLSERRKDVLVLISEGYSNGEIAASLGISEATVKAHVSALMNILDADNRYHCVAEARKLGLVS